MNSRNFRGAALAAAFALGSAWGLPGCGSASTGDSAATIKPEVQKQTQDMLQNYGKQYADQARAKKK